MKKLLIAALAATLCCTTSITGYGAIREDEVVSPQYENAKQPVCSILISGSTANVECNVTAKGTSVNSISGILTLQHKNTSASWDDVSIARLEKIGNYRPMLHLILFLNCRVHKLGSVSKASEARALALALGTLTNL